MRKHSVAYDLRVKWRLKLLDQSGLHLQPSPSRSNALGRRRRRSQTVLTALMMLLAGCATSMNSDHQSVTLFSAPPEAKVIVDDVVHMTTPGTVSLNRKSDHVALVEKEGYEPATIKIERTWSWWVVGDVSCLIFVFNCIAKDRHDGGYWTFDDEINVPLTQRATIEIPALKSP